LPHFPQFCGSIDVFVHDVPQVVLGEAQTSPQVPPAQT
jgi:hypothetical protein